MLSILPVCIHIPFFIYNLHWLSYKQLLYPVGACGRKAFYFDRYIRFKMGYLNKFKYKQVQQELEQYCLFFSLCLKDYTYSV